MPETVGEGNGSAAHGAPLISRLPPASRLPAPRSHWPARNCFSALPIYCRVAAVWNQYDGQPMGSRIGLCERGFYQPSRSSRGWGCSMLFQNLKDKRLSKVHLGQIQSTRNKEYGCMIAAGKVHLAVVKRVWPTCYILVEFPFCCHLTVR